MSDNSRNNGIDALKCMAAILIVAIHCASVTLFDQAVHLIGRMSVFLFYMITGFYLDGLFKRDKIGRYINKILKITVFAYVLYLCIYLASPVSGTLSLDVLPSADSLLIWLFSGSNDVGGHLWYLNSLILALCFIVLIRKLGLYNSWLPIVVLFASNYILATFVDDIWIYRNFLFMATPCILFGKKLKETIERESFPNIILHSNKILGLMICISIVLLFFETWTCNHLGVNMYRDFYLSLIPLCSFVYILFYEMKGENRVFRLASWIGNRLSTYIYIYHFCIVNMIYSYCHGYEQFLISVVITILVSYIHYSIKSKYLRWKTVR